MNSAMAIGGLAVAFLVLGFSPIAVAAPGDYLHRSGGLRFPLRMEVETLLYAVDRPDEAAVGGRFVLHVALNGNWMYTVHVGAGAARTGVGRAGLVIGAQNLGTLTREQARQIADAFSANDLQSLRGYKHLGKVREADMASVAYRVTIVFGRRTYTCLLRDFGGAPSRNPRPDENRPDEDVTERFSAIALKLLEIVGGKLEDEGDE